MNSRARYPVMAAGLAVFALALTVLLGSEFGSDLAAAAVEAAGNDYVVLAAFGAFALLLVVLVAASRTLFGQDQAEPPDPEEVRSAPHPGDDFDRVVDDGLGLRTRLFGDGGEAVRERLRDHAVETVLRDESDVTSREAARERVLDGTWTDDDAAAAFLAGPAGPSPSLESRVAGAVRGETWFQYGTRRAADEVCRLLGVEAPVGDGADAPGPTNATEEPEFDGAEPAGTAPGTDESRTKSVRQARAAADGGRDEGYDAWTNPESGSAGETAGARTGTADTVVSDSGGGPP